MTRNIAILLLGLVLLAWPLDSFARKPLPVPDQAHLLYTYVKNKQKAKPERFAKNLLKKTRKYLEAYLATYPWKGDMKDFEAVQVVPYDMDSDEGSELFILFTGGPQMQGQPSYTVMLLDWVPEKWLFVPVFHDGWWMSGAPQADDEGTVTRKVQYWGLRWMGGRPVAVGHRVTEQEGPGTVKARTEELALAWFNWKNEENNAVIPLRYNRKGATECAEIVQEMKSFEAFVDIDWDNDVELVVYDVYQAEQSRKLSQARKCAAVPNKPKKEEKWLGIIIHDLEDGEVKQITGDQARKLVLRLGELGWLDSVPYVGVLGVFDKSEDAFAAKESFHDADLSTTWLFRAGKFDTFTGKRIVVTTTPFFDKKGAEKACQLFKSKAPNCTAVKLGENPPESFYKRFQKK
jgi:hypothetical protein